MTIPPSDNEPLDFVPDPDQPSLGSFRPIREQITTLLADRAAMAGVELADIFGDYQPDVITVICMVVTMLAQGKTEDAVSALAAFGIEDHAEATSMMEVWKRAFAAPIAAIQLLSDRLYTYGRLLGAPDDMLDRGMAWKLKRELFDLPSPLDDISAPPEPEDQDPDEPDPAPR